MKSHASAREAVNLALELDPLYRSAYGILGGLRFMADCEWAGAERTLARGLDLSPAGLLVRDAYGMMRSAQERFGEAIAAQRRARECDPLAPVANSDLTTTRIRAGRCDEAIGEASRLRETEPTSPLAHSTLGWALVLNGRPARSQEMSR